MPRTRTPQARRHRNGTKSDAAIESVLGYIAAGVPDEHAAAAAGIHRSTWWRWKKRDPGLQQRVEVAQSKAVAMKVAQISKAANDGNWTAAAWFLERRYPKEFGRVDRSKIEHSGTLTLEQLVNAASDPPEKSGE